MFRSVNQAGSFLARWLGGTTVDEIGRVMRRPRKGARALMQREFKQVHDAPAYNASAKLWLSPPRSKEKRPTWDHSPYDVFTILSAERTLAGVDEPRFACPIEDMSAYDCMPDSDAFGVLLAACAHRKAVDVTYLSKTRRFTTRFSPHKLVRTAHRMHFRGYSMIGDGRPGFYWDLVPSRVVAVNEAPVNDYVDQSGDIDWHDQISVSLSIVDSLPDYLNNAIRHEHCIDGNTLTLGPMPRALIRYAVSAHIDRRYEGWPTAAWQPMVNKAADHITR